MQISVNASTPYVITVENGCLERARTLLGLDRRVLIVTDSGVPSKYSQLIAKQSASPCLVTIEQGEASKSTAILELLLTRLFENGFSRSDCVVAVGGGVVGDVSGLAAALYMRGIDFYNVPTTLLAQIDSSVGGKTAINFQGMKNLVGIIHQPAAVLIDPTVLSSLPRRQINAGLAEAFKMGLTLDPELANACESCHDDYSDVIRRSVSAKAHITELDEGDHGLRHILNFGHTIGHAIESASQLSLLHGECVALGMLPFSSGESLTRLRAFLKARSLPLTPPVDSKSVFAALAFDKKRNDLGFDETFSCAVGSYERRLVTQSEIESLYSQCFGANGECHDDND